MKAPFRIVALTLLGLFPVAQAQVGGPRSQLTQLPALSNFKANGSALSAPDGTRLSLKQRGDMVLSAQVEMPKFDPVQAGKLLGALTGYGDDLGQPYANYLKDPAKRSKLQGGSTIMAEQYEVFQQLSGQKFRFTVSLPEVPSSAFATTKNVRGPANAPVVVRLYSDFQCPYCEKFEVETWPSLQKALGQNVRFEYHHFPLESIHPNARPAAEASECAAQQGRFWAYHDALFAPQNWTQWTKLSNPNSAFITYAQRLKLNDSRFKDCLALRGGKAAVDAGVKEALSLGVNGTPTLFVNGFKAPSPYDVSAIMNLVQNVQK